MKNKALLAILFIISTIILLLPLFLQTKLQNYETLGILGIFLINLVSASSIFLPTPSIISVGIGGNLYNPLFVAIAASLGAALGESIAFIFGFSSREFLNLKKHKLLYHVEKYLKKHLGTVLILIFSFIPNPFFDGLGIVVGLSSYPLKKFLFLVFIGRLLRNIIIAYLGAKF